MTSVELGGLLDRTRQPIFALTLLPDAEITIPHSLILSLSPSILSVGMP